MGRRKGLGETSVMDVVGASDLLLVVTSIGGNWILHCLRKGC